MTNPKEWLREKLSEFFSDIDEEIEKTVILGDNEYGVVENNEKEEKE